MMSDILQEMLQSNIQEASETAAVDFSLHYPLTF